MAFRVGVGERVARGGPGEGGWKGILLAIGC